MNNSHYENYDVECRLNGAEQYCNKYSGSPCCFFCKDKPTCSQACMNEPIACGHSVCKNKEKE